MLEKKDLVKRLEFRKSKVGLAIFFLISSQLFASTSGLPIGDILSQTLEYAKVIGYFAIGIGIISFVVMMKLGSRESALSWGIGTIIGGAIIANIETILSWMGLTGGVNF